VRHRRWSVSLALCCWAIGAILGPGGLAATGYSQGIISQSSLGSASTSQLSSNPVYPAGGSSLPLSGQRPQASLPVGSSLSQTQQGAVSAYVSSGKQSFSFVGSGRPLGLSCNCTVAKKGG